MFEMQSSAKVPPKVPPSAPTPIKGVGGGAHAGQGGGTFGTTHHTPYLSPSRLALYERCPALYHRFYVLGIKDPPTIDMEFGQAVHAGLEAMFRGQDAELVFVRDLERRLILLRAQGCDPADWLAPQGLSLLERVGRLKWSGAPERKFFWPVPGFAVSFHGVVDLWSPDQAVATDWKTTQRPWSDKTADRYVYQRVIYTQSLQEEFNCEVTFRFVALGAYPGGGLQIIESTPQPREVAEVLNRAREIASAIERNEWSCTCRDQRHAESAA